MPRKQKAFHYIYKTTCDVTKRYYYGMHSTDRLDDGYIGSGTRLWHSINYHGKENHSIEILEYLDNRIMLKDREKELITEDMLNDPMCMNLRPGGVGGFIDNEHYERFKKACSNNGSYHKYMMENDISYKEKWVQLMKECRPSFEDEKNGFYGKKHSEESKKKMRNVNRHGKRNSQFGTCWVTDGKTNKKVDKTLIPSLLKDGTWRKGRVMKK